MSDQKTHREVKHPQISIRYLADYMAASEQARRTIIRGCKYQPIARVVQHDEAKLAVSKFIRSGLTDIATLQSEAQRLRDRMADSEFDRDVLDHNVDYIERFAQVSSKLDLPNAEILPPANPLPCLFMERKSRPKFIFGFAEPRKQTKSELARQRCDTPKAGPFRWQLENGNPRSCLGCSAYPEWPMKQSPS
jgi:hypothetical protein